MAITAHENMNMIAVGFKDGTVLLLHGNIARDRQSRVRQVHEEKAQDEKAQGIYVTGKKGVRESLVLSHHLQSC